MKTNTLNGILIGLIIVLVGVVLVQDGRNNPAAAATDPEDARTTSSTGVGANGVIAVTGQYSSDNSVLYVIDTNREVILTYACYASSRGMNSQFRQPKLDFLNGRLYTWDAIYSQKGTLFGSTDSPPPAAVRERVRTNEEE